MITYKTWKLEFHFKDGQHVSRFIRSEHLRLGRSPKCDFRHPLFTQEIEVEIETLARGEVRELDLALGKLRISEVTVEKWDRYTHQWDNTHSEDVDMGAQSPILWHFRNGMLLSTSLLEDFLKTHALTTGLKLTWKKDDPYTLVLTEGDDFRCLQLERSDKGHLVAEYEDNKFVVTQAEDSKQLGRLQNPEETAFEPKSKFQYGLLAAIGTWMVFVFVMNFGAQFLPKEVVDEVLPPEIAKMTIEKAPEFKGKKQKGGGNGQEGGGGVETVAENDPRGGSGASAEETVVGDKALFGAAKIMNALSALDEGMQTGKVAAAGIVAVNTKGSTTGILGALASLTGKGKGANGLGIGGLGTKGFGGGGGGGTGSGFGTGVGAGLGKGDGLRNISFDNDAASVRGGLEKSEVDAVVKENFSQVRYCYNKALRNNPQLQGKLISNFVIGADGMVKTSRIKDSSLGVPEVENCVKGRVATWKFPQPRGGSTVEVSYPFLLKSF